MTVCPGHMDVKEGPQRDDGVSPIRHPREIGEPAKKVKKNAGFLISLWRFWNDAVRDDGVSRSHG